MSIDPSGNVGIGTTNPVDLLTLSGSSSPYVGINSTSASNKRTGLFFKSNSTPQFEIGVDGNLDNTRNFYIYDSVALQPRIHVNAAGNVGIGTASQGQKLTVAGTIESTSGGVRFPDATTQASSAFGPAFYMSGGSVSTSSSATKIPLNSATIDTDASINVGSSRVIPTKAGYYSVTGKVNVSMTGTGGFTIYGTIYKNGTVYEGYSQLINYTSSFSQTVTVTTLVYVNGTTDYLELFCGTNSGTATCTGNLSGHYVRP